MKTVTATIWGTRPLLSHRFGEAAEGELAATTRRVKVMVQQETPRSQAEKAAYRLPDGRFWVPGAAFARLMREAGSGIKIKGTRKSAKHGVPAAVTVMDDAVVLLDPNTNEPLTNYEVDSRPVVIPSTKGRIMRHRPRFDSWAAKVTIRVNDALMAEDFIFKLMADGGEQLGIGDFRPEKGGPFGTFRVVGWDVADGIAPE